MSPHLLSRTRRRDAAGQACPAYSSQTPRRDSRVYIASPKSRFDWLLVVFVDPLTVEEWAVHRRHQTSTVAPNNPITSSVIRCLSLHPSITYHLPNVLSLISLFEIPQVDSFVNGYSEYFTRVHFLSSGTACTRVPVMCTLLTWKALSYLAKHSECCADVSAPYKLMAVSRRR